LELGRLAAVRLAARPRPVRPDQWWVTGPVSKDLRRSNRAIRYSRIPLELAKTRPVRLFQPAVRNSKETSESVVSPPPHGRLKSCPPAHTLRTGGESLSGAVQAGDGRAAAVAHDQKPDWGPVWFCCNSTVYESALPGAEGSSLPAFRTRVRRRAMLGRSLPHIMFIETRAGLIEWEPDNAARTVAAVAVSRLVEGTDQLPFL
jgi:hypothetical protein